MGRIKGSKVVNGKVVMPTPDGAVKNKVIGMLDAEIGALEKQLDSLRAAKAAISTTWVV